RSVARSSCGWTVQGTSRTWNGRLSSRRHSRELPSSLMNLELTDRVAIVTGSSRGLGLAAAPALHPEGARAVPLARGGDALAAAVAALGGGERVRAVVADVSTPDGAQRVVADAMDAFGRVDILVNNVGKAGGAGIDATSDEEWQSAFDQTLVPAIR